MKQVSNILSYGDRAPLPYSQHWGGFPLESIGANSNAAGATRIELGFLGSHAENCSVNGAVSGSTERTMGFGTSSNSMTYADTQDPKNNFIIYQDRSTLARYTDADVWDEKNNKGTKGVTSSMVGKLIQM